MNTSHGDSAKSCNDLLDSYNASRDHFHTDAAVPSSDHCCYETVGLLPSSDHYCTEKVLPSSDHYCTDAFVVSGAIYRDT